LVNARSHPATPDRYETTRSFARAATRFHRSAEKRPWSILRNRNLDGRKFRRQVTIDSYVVDFCCIAERLIIELDGEQHADARKRYDDARKRDLVARGYRVLRFWNSEVLQESEGVIQEISRMLSAGDQSAK
jgi:very-short-patch-repair endonuclease